MTDRETPFLSPLRHRVLQVDGRRYSVRLEESYWAVLEELAGRRGLRLARIIDEVAAAAKGEASLASALRLRCLGVLGEKLADGLKASRAASGAGGRYTASLENLVTANPAPSLLIAHDGKILLANVAFQNWSGVKAEALVGQPYDWFFQLRLSHGLQETIDRLIHGTEGHRPARISYIAPGRVVVANGVVCLGHYAGPRDFTWTIMIGNVTPSASSGDPPAPREPAR
ncbi:MAG: ribbon-helix-helix domain-containing protein [Alphaproteobacteria bacterium]|nr:ribbon-helix-helix domain-containing protein [Alphaproteobacteria bacterium]